VPSTATPAGSLKHAGRQARLDVLGDLVTDHLDTAALSRLIEGGPPPGMPSLLVSLNHGR
jgi:adenosylcobyric acid synthase